MQHERGRGRGRRKSKSKEQGREDGGNTVWVRAGGLRGQQIDS